MTSNVQNQFYIFTPESRVFPQGKITLKLNHDWREERQGDAKAYHSVGAASNRFLESANGLFRLGQLFGNKVWAYSLKHLGGSSVAVGAMEACSAKSVAAWTWLTTIPRTISMTGGVVQDVQHATAVSQGVKQLPADQAQYAVEKAFDAVTDYIAMLGHSVSQVLSLFPGTSKVCSKVFTVAEVSTLAHDTTSLKLHTENYARVRALDLKGASDTMKKTVEETKQYNLLLIAKDVVSFVSGFFGACFLATGVAVLPGIALAVLSLASTLFSISSALYRETMWHKPINVLSDRASVLV